MSDRLVLITGGSGYIGSVLAPLVAKLYPVRVLETMAFGNPIMGTPNIEFHVGDIRDKFIVRDALKGVTDVIHLAAIVTDDLVDMNPQYSREVNVQALQMLCEQAVDAGVSRFIYASSSSIYGSSYKPCTENSTPNPVTAYAQMKLLGEKVVEQYKHSMRVTSIRSATACGPSPRMRLDTIVNVFCKQAFFHKNILVHGGDQWRSNIHVRDIADLYKFLLDIYVENEPVFNATFGHHTAIELALMVKDLIPAEITVNHDIVDGRHYKMVGNRISAFTGWRPKYPIEKAIWDNQRFFADGGISDPDSDLYINTKRMKDTMEKG